MKKIISRITSLLICCILFAAVVTGCSESKETVEEATTTTPTSGPTTIVQTPETITITDASGREVTLTKPVQTIASGYNMVTDYLRILDVQDHIVAVDPWFPILYGELTELPLSVTSVDEYYAVDFELMLEMSPDVFITAVIPQPGYDDIVATLEPEVPCIAVDLTSPGKIYESMQLLGEIFDSQEAAQEYIDFYKGTLDMISERVSSLPEEEKTTVYYEMMPYYTFGEGLALYQYQIETAGGINIAADMETAYGTVDPEWVLEQNPEVIVTVAMPYDYMGVEGADCGYDVDDDTSMAAFRDTLMSRPELEHVAAVASGRVHVICAQLPNISTLGYAYMAKWLYPELFEDFDPQAVHQEYLDRFLKIDYDLDEHGVFVYPEP